MPPGVDVAVIGAGVAGLAAATRLAEAGLRVAVFEEAPRLGGRASAFTDRETGERVDNGQHVLFGCYRETYGFLRRIGTADLAPLDPRLELAMAATDGRPHVLRCPPLPAPWHLVAGILAWTALGVRDRLSALGVGRLLVRARSLDPATIAADVPHDQTVSAWLAARGQSPRLCEWLWHPLTYAALNQSPDVAAARPFVRVLAEMFGPEPNSSAIGLPVVPLDELYAEPSVHFIEGRGGSVTRRAAARVLVQGDRAVGVQVGNDATSARAVVSAVPWHAFPRLWTGDPPSALATTAASAAALGSSPIVTVNLWFDGPVMQTRLLGLVDGPMHWAFDKSAFFAAPAGHLSVVASGADALARMDNHAVVAAAMSQLRCAIPAIGARALVRSVVVREHRATFSLAPDAPPRPGCRTTLPGFFLAGDWTDTGLPGTIEGAALSGHRAASLVIDALRC